ncbi:MAG: methylmalonyl-CoA mutase [Candidatus Rokubacteria bacterium]|nr:methylmalonyl-CoA mutase [Candidatus Rokubacteria bacterium]
MPAEDRRGRDDEQARRRTSVRQFVSSSGIPLKPCYVPEGARQDAGTAETGRPGEFPYTRGIHPLMYREQLWSMRKNAGYASPAETNALFKMLAKNGLTGFNLAIDLPTQMGYDSDHPRARGEVGRTGVALDTVEDLEAVYEGIPLASTSTSSAINGIAPIFMAMYVVAAERQGAKPDQLRGTWQNDILKEMLARGTYLFPPKPSIRLVCDVIEYCMKAAPRFYPVSVSSCHMVQAGATAVQGLAYTFLNAMVYIDEMLRRGYHIDEVVPCFTFLTQSNLDLFETVARARAARRVWAKLMKTRYGASTPKALAFKAAMATDQTELTIEQPLNNLARLTLGVLGAVLGGAQSVMAAAYDEAFDIASEESNRLSLMLQNIIAYETRVPYVADPLGGSYYVEALTSAVEEEVDRIIEEIEHIGGMVAAIEQGIVQRRISEPAFQKQQRIEAGEEIVVGVNKFRVDEDRSRYEKDVYQYDAAFEKQQVERLQARRRLRDARAVQAALDAVRKAAEDPRANTIPPLIEACRVDATVGEMTEVLRTVFGTFRVPTGF